MRLDCLTTKRAAISAALLLLLALPEASGVPACPFPAMIVQPDGSRIQIRLKGDEFFHWHEDSAGYTILREEFSRRWVHAVPDGQGGLAPGRSVVGRDDPAWLGIPRRLRPAAVLTEVSAADTNAPSSSSTSSAAPKAAKTGLLKNLVVLVQFPDLTATHTKQEFEALFNTNGYSLDGARGSVRDYYHEVSYGALTVDSVVADWVTLDHGYAYYGTNNASGNDLRPQQMVSEALAKLAATGFDFSTLDADSDGYVDGLTVIHAGGGEEYSGNDPNYIWSHKSVLSTIVTYSGKKMQNYHTEPERRGFDSNPGSWGITRIGVVCHETGHFLGLPDLYDTTYASKGAGDFCIMAGGSWNGDHGSQPAHMSAWCKKFLGWVIPTVVSSGGDYGVPQIENNQTLYQLNGKFPSTQYFLIENRQGFGFDAGLPGYERGLLIWHIDETQANNDTASHYKVDLEEASGTQHLELNQNEGNDADYYRQNNNGTFTATSVPSNLSYAAVPLGLDISAVSASASNMTFTIAALPPDQFNWGLVPSPQVTSNFFPVGLTASYTNGSMATQFAGGVGLSAWASTNDTTVGSGTSSWNYPLSNSRQVARTQVIYLASELGGPGLLTALALDVATRPGQTLNNWTIRVKPTTLTSYPLFPSWDGDEWTTVLKTNQLAPATGWAVFNFTAPFLYDGTNNLLVDFSYFNTSSSSDGQSRYTSVSGNRAIYYRTTSTSSDPLTWSGTSPAPTRIARIPNLKLSRRTGIDLAPVASGNFNNGSWTGSVAVMQSSTNVILRADDSAGHSGVSAPFAVRTLSADLAVGLSGTPAVLNLGSNVAYTITVTNLGPDTATNAMLTDTLPAGLSFLAATTSAGSFSNESNIVSFDLGPMISGARATLTVTALATASGSLTNQAVAFSSTPDLTLANNTAMQVISVNTPPVISAISDQATSEDTPTGAIVFTVGDQETAPTGLALAATSSNTNMLPAANIVLGGSGSNRTVTLTPRPDQFGTANITIFVSDGLATASTEFPLTVIAVNDRPTLDPISPLTLHENASPQTVNLSGIYSGAANESQTLTVTAVSDHPDLIANPTVTYTSPATTGTLSFTPATNANGTAVITVTVRDDGGTDSGGQDEITRSFSVVVNPAIDLALSQTASPNPVGFGSNLVCTLTVTNASAFGASDVVLTNPLPLGASLVSATASQGNFTNTGSILVCSLGEIAGNAAATVTLEFFPTNGGLLTNVGVVVGTAFDPEPTNNTASVIASVAMPPTISLSTTQVTTEVVPPDPVSFTIDDPDTAADALEISAHSSNTNLVPDANLLLSGSGTNRVLMITPATNEFGSSAITITVSDGLASTSQSFLLIVQPVIDLALAQVLTPDPVQLSSNLTCTLTITNSSSFTASGVVVSNPLPLGVSLLSAVPTQGSYTNDGASLLWQVGELSSHAGATLTLLFEAVSTGNFTNSAFLIAAEFDSNLTNNSATARVTVVGDTDGDGMPDDYELAHGFNPADPTDAAADVDEDGMTNLAEYLAGTNPHDQANLLRTTEIWRTGDDIALTFTTVLGKSYRIEYNGLPISGPWLALTNNVPGTGLPVLVLDSGAAALGQRVYRIVLER